MNNSLFNKSIRSQTGIIFKYIYFAVLLFIIDLIWLSRPFHKELYTKIQKAPLIFDKLAGILFYLLAPLGYFIFVKPLSKNKMDAFKYGAIIGFLMYMSYDLTSKAIYTDYTWNYAIKDIVWGSLLVGAVSYIMFTENYSQK